MTGSLAVLDREELSTRLEFEADAIQIDLSAVCDHPSEFFTPLTAFDHFLELAAHSALHRAGYPSLRKIDVASDGGCLWLFGEVPSYYLKQTAQRACQSISGVQRVNNQLAVRGVS